jgi:hypothetical protein
VRLPCSWCDAEFGVPEFLDHCRFHWRDVHVVRWDCPRCGKWEDVALEPDEIRRGYVYSAGVPHFAHMDGSNVPGLRPRRADAALRVEYAGRVWHVPDLGAF